MRLATWNCKLGFSNKKSHLFELEPDISVVQECSRRSALECEELGYSVRFIGKDSHGLAVLARRPWTVEILEEPRYKLIAPFKVTGPRSFLVLGVWTGVVGNAAENYIGQLHRAVLENPHWFPSTATLAIGDFNSNAIWDKKRRIHHSDVVAMLEEHGLQSAYHSFMREAQGRETVPTHYLQHLKAKPYHIDYQFIPKTWEIKHLSVGDYERWHRRSDHMPLSVDV